MDSKNPKINSKDLNKAVRIANVSDADDIMLKKSDDGKYNVKVALVHGGALFGPVIIKVKKNFDAQAEVPNVASLLKPNTRQGISVAVDAPAGIKPNGKLRILWMEVPAKEISSCDGKGSGDLLILWKKLEQEGNGIAMRDIKLKISNAVNLKPVATKVPLVTLKHPGSSKEKSVVAQEAVVKGTNSLEIQARSPANESLEQLRLVQESENNISKYEEPENAEPKPEALQTSSELDTVADTSTNELPTDLSTVSVPEEINIDDKDSEKARNSPKILKSYEFNPSEECKVNLESVVSAPDLREDRAEHILPVQNAPDSNGIVEDEIQEDFYDSVLSLCPIIAEDTSLVRVNDELALEETRKRIQEVRELIQIMGMTESETEGSHKDQCAGPIEDGLGISEITSTAEKQGHSEAQMEAGSLQDAINSLMEDEKSKAKYSPPGHLEDERSVTSDFHGNCVSSTTAADLWDTNTLIQRLSVQLIDPLDFIDQLSGTQEAGKESQMMDQKSSIERSHSKRIENLRKNIMFKDQVIEGLKAMVQTLQEEIQERKTLEIAVWNEDTSSKSTVDASVQIDCPIESTSYDAVDLAVVKSTDMQNSPESMESIATLPLDIYGSSFPLEPPKFQIMGCRERRPFVSTTSWKELRTSFEVDWLRGNTVHPFIHMRMIAADEEMYRVEICIPAAAKNSTDVSFGSCFFQVKFLDLQGHPIASRHFFFDTKNGTCRNGPAELLTHSCQAITYTSPACINLEKLISQVYPHLGQSVERSINTEIIVEMWMMSTGSPLEDSKNLLPTFEDRIRGVMRWSLSDMPPVMRKFVFCVGTQPPVDVTIGEHLLTDCSPVFNAILDEQMINGSRDQAWIRLPQVLPRTVFAFSDFLHGRCTHEYWQRNFQLNLHMLKFSMFFLIRELVTKCIWNLLDMHHADFILEEVIMLIEVGRDCRFTCLVDRGLQWLHMESQVKSVGSSVMITSIPDEENEQVSTPPESLLPTSTPSAVSLKKIIYSKDDRNNSENGDMSEGVIRSTSDVNSLPGSLEENSTRKQDSPSRRNGACCLCGEESLGYMYCYTHFQQRKYNAKRTRQCFKCEKVGHKYSECNVKPKF